MNYATLHSVPAATAMADLFKLPLLQDLAAQRGSQRPTIGEPLFLADYHHSCIRCHR